LERTASHSGVPGVIFGIFFSWFSFIIGGFLGMGRGWGVFHDYGLSSSLSALLLQLNGRGFKFSLLFTILGSPYHHSANALLGLRLRFFPFGSWRGSGLRFSLPRYGILYIFCSSSFPYSARFLFHFHMLAVLKKGLFAVVRYLARYSVWEA
jgi:hypothetical protein